MTTLRKQFFLFALVTFLVLVRSVVFAQTDRDELISLYNATGGDSWSSNSGWKDSPTSARMISTTIPVLSLFGMG